MTGKRFYYFGDGENINSGVIDGDTELTLEETVGIMNELHEEKEIAIEGIKVANDLINRYGGDELKHKWKKEVNVND